MSKLVWDKSGEHKYETGVDHGVLYVAKKKVTNSSEPYEDGVAWNGLTSVSESGSGGEPTPLWADNIKYLNLISAEECSFSIEAYSYPKEFRECNGQNKLADGIFVSQQTRRSFGFSYRTIIGNDTKANEYGYKLHLAYGCYASPSNKQYTTTNDSPEAITFSWSVTTTPVSAGSFKPTALLILDSTRVHPAIYQRIEDILYGSSKLQPRLPMPTEIASMFDDDYWTLIDSNGQSITDSNGKDIIALGILA